MTTDQDFERQVRGLLRDTLERETGPDPVWADSPAARRVVVQESNARRRWPLRLLAVAAVIGAVGGGALLAGALAEPPDTSGVAGNGWIALTVDSDSRSAYRNEDIWLVALDKEARRVIGTDTDQIRQLCPAFAPDGRSLAYGQVDGRNAALVIADVSDDGRADDRLTIDVGDGLPPPCAVWSPDGAQIAFGVPRTSPINPTTSGAGSEVWVVRLADSKVAVIPDLLATDLDWSPDGSLLAFVGGVETASGEGVIDGLQDAQIHLYEPSTGTLRTLEGTLGAGFLSWSPDSRRLAYTSRVVLGSGEQLRVVDFETGRERVLVDRFGATHGIGPVWSPNGEAIVYQRCDSVPCEGESHDVVLVMLGDQSDDSAAPREMVIPSFQKTAQGSGPIWPYRVTWSPDSQYLLYVGWSSGWTGGTVDPMVVAVHIDPEMPAVLLSRLEGQVAKDGYRDDTTFVPIQTWGRLLPD